MNINKMIIGILVMLFIISTVSAANEVYLDPGTVYIPESGNATVEIRMNATDNIDTWSTKIAFDSTSVNIVNVDFTGSITPVNASWGHHGDYIYLGGTELTASNGNELLLATLTIECLSICGCEHDLEFTGIENIERLIAGPPHGTIYSATWVNGIVLCLPQCGDVNCDVSVDWVDYIILRANTSGVPGWTLNSAWAADVNNDNNIDWVDYIILRANTSGVPGWILNCACS